MKKQTGITLIALVITIIVLLILAGVSISMVVGNNGVLTQASTAVVKTKEAKAREEVALAWSSVDSEYWTAWTDNSNVKKDEFFTVENLQKYLEGKGTVTSVNYAEGKVEYKKEGEQPYTFIIDANGNIVKSESGSGEEEIPEVSPYAIGTQILLNGTTSVVTGLDSSSNPVYTTLDYTRWRVINETTDTVTLLAEDVILNSTGKQYLGDNDFIDDQYGVTALSGVSLNNLDTNDHTCEYNIQVPGLYDGELDNVIEVSENTYTLKGSYEDWFFGNGNKMPMVVGSPDYATLNENMTLSTVLEIGDLTVFYRPILTIQKSEIPAQ